MEQGLLWFCLCLFILNGALGYTKNNLEEKIEKLEKKMELMYDVVTQLTSENDDLKTRLKTLEHLVIDGNNSENHQREPLSGSGNSDAEQIILTHKTNNSENQSDNNLVERSFHGFYIKDGISVERKRKAAPASSPTEVIAFHAYISKDNSGYLAMHHILQFDVVPLNRGNHYSAFDGIFIVPTSGTYVFTWSIMSDVHGSVHTELMRNAEIIGTRYADSYSSEVWDFATGIVVAGVNQGDHVYVRLGANSKGNVRSIGASRSTFSGWLLP